MIIREVIECIQPHHKNVYTCIGQARDQTMTSSPITISVEGIVYKLCFNKRNNRYGQVTFTIFIPYFSHLYQNWYDLVSDYSTILYNFYRYKIKLHRSRFTKYNV